MFLGYVRRRLAGEVDQLRSLTRTPVAEVLDELGNIVPIVVEEPSESFLGDRVGTVSQSHEAERQILPILR